MGRTPLPPGEKKRNFTVKLANDLRAFLNGCANRQLKKARIVDSALRRYQALNLTCPACKQVIHYDICPTCNVNTLPEK